MFEISILSVLQLHHLRDAMFFEVTTLIISHSSIVFLTYAIAFNNWRSLVVSAFSDATWDYKSKVLPSLTIGSNKQGNSMLEHENHGK